MDWKTLLASITGSVDQALLLRNAYGEASLRHALHECVEHDHHERNHQGKGNVLLFPAGRHSMARQGALQCREWFGGLLKYYERDIA